MTTPKTSPSYDQGLVKRLSGAVDIPNAGLAFALVAVVIAVLVFGLAPTAIGFGLLALLVVE
jgi:hypothetical protein